MVVDENDEARRPLDGHWTGIVGGRLSHAQGGPGGCKLTPVAALIEPHRLLSRPATMRHPVARRVALICMPFQQVELPSLALATLSRILRDEGHHVDVLHLNLEFAARIGLGPYEEILSYPGWLRLLGEWLFADQEVAPGAASIREFRQGLVEHKWRDRAQNLERLDLESLRAAADEAIVEWFQSRMWESYDVVGFTVMFQQLNPSLRLGRLIKSARSDVRVVLGGSAMEMPMGQPILDRHPWIDAVFSGYAERAFADYVNELPGRKERVVTQTERVHMDDLPVPDFDEFFASVDAAGLTGAADFCVPIETSRGCWWGERQHCIFCGLNALDMTQRSKSADRVFREVMLQLRHGHPFFATDNILPLEFFKGLLERFATAEVPFRTFYETKANLSLEHLRALKRAGVYCIQPGIESLSTPILRYMKKGVTAGQNLWILRAAEELGLGVAWSILYGFPGEDPKEYARIAELLPALSHLPPPLRPAPVLLERYSPLFNSAAEYGLSNVRPTTAHRSAFGDSQSLADRAYIFDFDYRDGRNPDSYTQSMNRGVSAWIEARRRLLSPRCEVFRAGPLRIAFDSRRRDRVGRDWPRLHVLGAGEWDLVRLTERLTDRRKLEEAWTAEEPLGPILESFLRRKWVLSVDGRLVRILMDREKPTAMAEMLRAASGGLRRFRRALARGRSRVVAVTVEKLPFASAFRSSFKSAPGAPTTWPPSPDWSRGRIQRTVRVWARWATDATLRRFRAARRPGSPGERAPRAA